MKQRIAKLHITNRRILISVLAIIGVIVLALIAWAAYLRFVKGYVWAGGTGFGGKTVWDWMELLVIPAVLGIGALLFNRSEKANELKIEERRVSSQ